MNQRRQKYLVNEIICHIFATGHEGKSAEAEKT
jgi:hypothetical protein